MLAISQGSFVTRTDSGATGDRVHCLGRGDPGQPKLVRPGHRRQDIRAGNDANRLAALVRDDHPVNVDVDHFMDQFAQRSCSGNHDGIEGHVFANGFLGLGGEIAWPRPARPGDTLYIESEIIEIRPSRSKPDQGIVTVRSTMLNQGGEAVYLLTAKLLVVRRPT